MSLRLRVWLFWRRVRLLIAGLFDRGDGRAASRPTDAADPLGMLGDDLARAAERMDADAALGLPQPDAGYEPVEITPALRARRDGALAELMEAQGRRQERRVRVQRARVRARVALVGATAVLLLSGVAGASALTGWGFGVQPLDRLVEGLRDHQPDPELPDVGEVGGPDALPPKSLLRLAPGGNNFVTVEVPEKQGEKKAVAASYVSEDGFICSAVAWHGSELSEPTGSGGGCIRPADLEHRLTAAHAFATGLEVGQTLLLNGFASTNVEELSLSSPYGTFDVRLSAPWTPVPGAKPIRMFVAGRSFEPAADGRIQAEEADDALRPDVYDIKARLSSGEIVKHPAWISP